MNKYKKYLAEQEKQLDELICSIQKSLAKAPEGGLRIIQNHGYRQYYRRGSGKNDEYIRKGDLSLAKALAQKEYDGKLLKMLEADRKEIKNAWKGYDERKQVQVYEELSDARKELVTPRIVSDQDFIRQWESREYERKYIGDETPEIYTERGERVRSKSEKLIADKLLMMGIPYRYECPMILRGLGKIYPDFTLLNVADRKELILEHLGMMDEKEYCEKAIRKINIYMKNGIFPGQKLILTYETSHNPIDMRSVQKLLERFCLNSEDNIGS